MTQSLNQSINGQDLQDLKIYLWVTIKIGRNCDACNFKIIHGNQQKISSKFLLLWLWTMYSLSCYMKSRHEWVEGMNEKRDTWRTILMRKVQHFLCCVKCHYRADSHLFSTIHVRLNASKLQQLRFHFKTTFFQDNDYYYT